MFCCNSLKLRITVQKIMPEVLQIFGPTLVASSWAGEVFLSTPSTSPSRPTLGLEVHEFYLNLLSFSVFLPSFFTVVTVFSPNHTHLMNSSVTADWNGGDG